MHQPDVEYNDLEVAVQSPNDWWRRRPDGKDIVDGLLSDPRRDLFPELTVNDDKMKVLVERYTKITLDVASDEEILSVKATVCRMVYYTLPRPYRWDQKAFMDAIIKIDPALSTYQALNHKTLAGLNWALGIFHRRKFRIALEGPDGAAHLARCEDLERERQRVDELLEEVFDRIVPKNTRKPPGILGKISNFCMDIVDILALGEK